MSNHPKEEKGTQYMHHSVEQTPGSGEGSLTLADFKQHVDDVHLRLVTRLNYVLARRRRGPIGVVDFASLGEKIEHCEHLAQEILDHERALQTDGVMQSQINTLNHIVMELGETDLYFPTNTLTKDR